MVGIFFFNSHSMYLHSISIYSNFKFFVASQLFPRCFEIAFAHVNDSQETVQVIQPNFISLMTDLLLTLLMLYQSCIFSPQFFTANAKCTLAVL